MPTVNDRSGVRRTPSEKCMSYFVKATPMWWYAFFVDRA
jgi:hypothetical protein